MNAIKGSYGIISTIADRLGINWNTARTYIREDKDARQLYEDERNTMLDRAESCIIDALEKNDTPTAKWFLQIKGDSRGYNGNGKDTLQDPYEFTI